MKPDQIDALVREQAAFVFDRMFGAMDKVRERMERACGALTQANVPYAVIGGNAVAAWVATRDEGAVRNTKDVDILLSPEDADAATKALAQVGFHRVKTLGVTMFLDGSDGKPSQAVHVIWAGEKVRADYSMAAPTVDQSRDIDGKRFVELLRLLEMKLVSNRDKDRVHVRDMIGVGLIDESWLEKLNPLLAQRLQELLDDPDG
jgi:hypothetical protein